MIAEAGPILNAARDAFPLMNALRNPVPGTNITIGRVDVTSGDLRFVLAQLPTPPENRERRHAR